MNIETVPAEFGTTTCEYSVACMRQTDKVIHLMVGTIPICDQHLEFYATH